MKTSANVKNVGIGMLATSANPKDILVAPHLGSCIAVAAYDRKSRLGALIHCLLPDSNNDPDKALATPELFVDSGVTVLLQGFINLGTHPRDLIITAAGGSNINDAGNFFQIGRKNYIALRKLLWKNNLLLQAEDIGGSGSRTVLLKIKNGEVTVKSVGGAMQLSKGVL